MASLTEISDRPEPEGSGAEAGVADATVYGRDGGDINRIELGQ